MIQSNLEKLIHRINHYIVNNKCLFNKNFSFKILLNIENKQIFKNGFCGAITAQGIQCSRKNKSDSIFCGLHRCDSRAHKRKRTKTINYLDIRDNHTCNVYEVVCDCNNSCIDMGRRTRLTYKNRNYLLDNTTNILYQRTDDCIIELGNFYRFNFNFKYI
uniref:Uncharacterized protein n=1 Tax=viral metagenome TaxID=1070528 RepID=A0A6C0B4R5_9ZZZZ